MWKSNVNVLFVCFYKGEVFIKKIEELRERIINTCVERGKEKFNEAKAVLIVLSVVR